MKLRDLEAGQLAVVLTGEFKHEIFYRNVAGIQSLTRDRYWPSAQAKVTGYEHFHRGPLDEEIELIDKDRLKHLTPTAPVVKVVEVGDPSEHTLLDYIRTGSSVAKLLWDLETVHLLRDRNASVVAVYRARANPRARATQVRERVTHYAMRELSNGYDRRVPLPALDNSGNKKVTTVRGFIRSTEDGE